DGRGLAAKPRQPDAKAADSGTGHAGEAVQDERMEPARPSRNPHLPAPVALSPMDDLRPPVSSPMDAGCDPVRMWRKAHMPQGQLQLHSSGSS
ncbi:MAG TPA: hypothetical protein PK144_08890, partial [Plasticicumulans sp.]|nr:hypothetical protein [Plasticicumulans sp.]